MKMQTMKDLVKSYPNLIPFKKHDLVEIEILGRSKNIMTADILGLAEGVIPFKEWGEEADDVKIGGKTLAYVLVMEDEKGRAILSLKRADRQRVGSTLNQKYKEKETLIVRGTEANKGGLLCEAGPVRGFLPVSQLSAAHYPRVGGDKNKILAKLKELVGQNLKVRIIGFDKKTDHPIFSEKAAQDEFGISVKTNDVLEGRVSGITSFGIFVNLGEFDGLVHISEASWNRIDDLNKLVKIGETIKVKVIGVEGGRVFLSIKRLTEDPFVQATKKFKEGDIVRGEVTKIVPFGVFVKLNGVEGLVKLIELSDKKIEDPTKVVTEGKKYKFKIIKIEQSVRRIALSLKQAQIVDDKKSKSSSTKKEKTKAKESKTKKKEG